MLVYGENVIRVNNWRTSECTNLEIRNSRETGRAAEADRVWSSNNSRNEKPYSVTGTIKHEGSKEAPKYKMLRKKYRNVGSCEYVETLFSMT